MSDTVLVTGGFGLVGSETVKRLAADGRWVVATDLDTPANRKKAEALPKGVDARWADLTDPEQVQRLISQVSPAAIIHLAAVIPPLIYRNARLARRVNVEATATVVKVAEAQPTPPRFVQAFGARNPHRNPEILRDDDPIRPCDLYSATKAEAEQIVRSSSLDWVVLRFGGVLGTDLSALPLTLDALYFESALPTDGRLHSVDVRDVAFACAAATTADAVGEILLIAGDESHRLRQGEVGATLSSAMGVPSALPEGRPGNPESESDWFVTDWMDTTRAQEALAFQRHSLPDMLAELQAQAGWKRYPGRLIAPVAHAFLKRRSAYWKAPGQYADPWGAIRAKLGEPAPDTT
jgi:nucleoside-diphosphate-sugar epimerase